MWTHCVQFSGFTQCLPCETVVIINLLKSLTTVVADKACSTEHMAKPSLLEEIMNSIKQRPLQNKQKAYF